MSGQRQKILKFGLLFAKTYIIYFLLFFVITVFVGFQAFFNETSFLDTIIYWMPTNLIVSFFVTIVLALDDYRAGRLKEKLK